MSREELSRIAAAALDHRGDREVEVTVQRNSNALTRFANNQIHQNVAEDTVDVSIRVRVGKREGRAGGTGTTPEALAELTARATQAAEASLDDPASQPLPSPAPIQAKTGDFVAATAETTPETRAKRVGIALAEAEHAQLTASGYLQTASYETLIANSRGIEAHHARTEAAFSATVSGDGSSGWVRGIDNDVDKLDTGALARTAVEKARMGKGAREIPPGEYTVVLEPAAVEDLLWFLLMGFNARAVHEKQSFLTGRLGEKLFAESIEWTDDVHHPLQTGEPFDGEGLPRTRVPLIQAGRPMHLVADRKSAAALGIAPTGHAFAEPNGFGAFPKNLVWQGGTTPLRELIAGTKQGILVTHFWYIRLVEPMSVTVTGLTRDGTFWIENGKIQHPIRNLRFNQSLVSMLADVEAMGPSVRTGGIEHEIGCNVAPPLRARNFRFSAVAPAAA